MTVMTQGGGEAAKRAALMLVGILVLLVLWLRGSFGIIWLMAAAGHWPWPDLDVDRLIGAAQALGVEAR